MNFSFYPAVLIARSDQMLKKSLVALDDSAMSAIVVKQALAIAL
jgi:hypothetical protein